MIPIKDYKKKEKHMIYYLLFIFLSPDLTLSYSVCFSWQGFVSSCILLLLSSPDEKKVKEGKKAVAAWMLSTEPAL